MLAPTGAARWFQRLAKDFQVSATSTVQVVDIGDMYDTDLYRWWIRATRPKHPVLGDFSHDVLNQMDLTGPPSWITVVGCDGRIRYQKEAEMDQARYGEVKALVTQIKHDPGCRP